MFMQKTATPRFTIFLFVRHRCIFQRLKSMSQNPKLKKKIKKQYGAECGDNMISQGKCCSPNAIETFNHCRFITIKLLQFSAEKLLQKTAVTSSHSWNCNNTSNKQTKQPVKTRESEINNILNKLGLTSAKLNSNLYQVLVRDTPPPHRLRLNLNLYILPYRYLLLDALSFMKIIGSI